MLSVTKLGPDSFQIAGSGQALAINKATYEDIFFAVPEGDGKYMASTYLYRLLVDQVCTDQAQRDTVIAILDGAGDREAALKALQDAVRGVKPD